jgi:hypothetical protein
LTFSRGRGKAGGAVAPNMHQAGGFRDGERSAIVECQLRRMHVPDVGRPGMHSGLDLVGPTENPRTIRHLETADLTGRKVGQGVACAYHSNGHVVEPYGGMRQNAS